MKKAALWIVLICLSIVIGWVAIRKFTAPPLGWKAKTPANFVVPNPTPNAPPTFKFDSSTDLQKELDSVNPQVLDSDFTDQ